MPCLNSIILWTIQKRDIGRSEICTLIRNSCQLINKWHGQEFISRLCNAHMSISSAIHCSKCHWLNRYIQFFACHLLTSIFYIQFWIIGRKYSNNSVFLIPIRINKFYSLYCISRKNTLDIDIHGDL